MREPEESTTIPYFFYKTIHRTRSEKGNLGSAGIFTLGARLNLGMPMHRMGRYGVAQDTAHSMDMEHHGQHMMDTSIDGQHD